MGEGKACELGSDVSGLPKEDKVTECLGGTAEER